jgi:hypothetical protein
MKKLCFFVFDSNSPKQKTLLAEKTVNFNPENYFCVTNKIGKTVKFQLNFKLK